MLDGSLFLLLRTLQHELIVLHRLDGRLDHLVPVVFLLLQVDDRLLRRRLWHFSGWRAVRRKALIMCRRALRRIDDLQVIQVDVARRAAAVRRAVAEGAIVDREQRRLAVGVQALHRHDPRLVHVAVRFRLLAGIGSINEPSAVRAAQLKSTHESEFSDSVSLSSPFWFFHFL